MNKQKPKNQTKNQTKNKFNAENMSLGRIASQVSLVLQNKNSADYQPNKISDNNPVVVFNLAKAKFTGQKLRDKKYYKYSGYPGGLKEKSTKELFNKDPRKLFLLLIKNMLPKNRLQKKRLQKLKLFVNEEK